MAENDSPTPHQTRGLGCLVALMLILSTPVLVALGGPLMAGHVFAALLVANGVERRWHDLRSSASHEWDANSYGTSFVLALLFGIAQVVVASVWFEDSEIAGFLGTALLLVLLYLPELLGVVLCLGVLFGIVAAVERLGLTASCLVLSWVAMLVAAIVVYFKWKSAMASALKSILVATILGTAPHVAYLLAANLAGDGLEPEALISMVMRAYETHVFALHDVLGDVLLPSFVAGTLVSLGFLALARGDLTSRTYRWWDGVRTRARFFGLCVYAATAFTAFTSLEANNWYPDARRYLEVTIHKAFTKRAHLLLQERVTKELQRSDSDLNIEAKAFAHRFLARGEVLPEADLRAAVNTAAGSKQIGGEGRQDGLVSIDRPNARTGAEAAKSDAAATEDKIKANVNEFHKTIASFVSEAMEGSLGHLVPEATKLAAAVLEDLAEAAATRVTSAPKNMEVLVSLTGRLAAFADRADALVRDAVRTSISSLEAHAGSGRLPALIEAERRTRSFKEALRQRIVESARRAR
jgi:hypothetical protein